MLPFDNTSTIIACYGRLPNHFSLRNTMETSALSPICLPNTLHILIYSPPLNFQNAFIFKLPPRTPFPYSLDSLKTTSMTIFTILLRLLALGATISAIVVMVTSHDSAEVLNLTFTAKYSNSPTFKYFVIIEAIASVYSFIVLFLSSKSLLWRLIIILDVVIAMLLTSSISAALAIAQVGKHGNSHAGWLPICGQVPKFCNGVTGALIAGFVAPITYLVLVLYSLHCILSPLFVVKP